MTLQANLVQVETMAPSSPGTRGEMPRRSLRIALASLLPVVALVLYGLLTDFTLTRLLMGALLCLIFGINVFLLKKANIVNRSTTRRSR